MADTPNDPRLSRRRPTDAELDQESIITQADIYAAIAAWNEDAPAEARGLLDAREESGNE